MTSLAITVVGHDRPGIIAQVTEALSRYGMNLEDSSMTLLRGHFAMTLVCSGDTDPEVVESVLAPLVIDGLTVTVREVDDESDPAPVGPTWLLTVHGGDRLGIVAALAEAVAEIGGNITDLSTRLSGELYVLLAEVDLPARTDITVLRATLDEIAVDLEIDVTLRPLDRDDL